jgi:N-acetylmuramoyl-L-alanine amidase
MPMPSHGRKLPRLVGRRGLVLWLPAVLVIVLLSGVGAAQALESTPSTLLQQSDSRLTYLGSWSYAAQAPASGGSFHWADSRGAAVMVSFTGTSFALLAKTNSSYGRALVSLDGDPAESVDLYSPTAVYQQRVYSRSGLGDGGHTLTIVCSGTKNDASSGYLVNVDALEILGTLTQAWSPVRYQQNDTDFNYVGSWSTTWTWSASGGSFTYSDSPGSAVNVTFDGTYLAWYAKTGPGYGKAQLSLDGGAPFLVDLYSSYDKYKQRVYNTGLLDDGSHTLSIYWKGQKSAAARGYRVDVDTFDVLGTLTAAPTPPPIPRLYQQSDSRITYLGSWGYAAQAPASGASFYHTSSPGAWAMICFTGTSCDLYAKTNSTYGKALVSVDGGAATEVDLYSPGALYQQKVYSRSALSEGQHTLTVAYSGLKNEASSGYLINVDALEVLGTLSQAPTLARYQQLDSHLFYSGTWAESTTASASGGTLYYADSPGASVVVNFEGVYLDWLAKTSPYYGRALVSLDGGTASEVDLYSPTALYQQRVYGTGPLSPGAHTLTVEWGGTRNPASAGYLVDVDAFSVLGSVRGVEPGSLAPERLPFALVGADKTRVTFALSGAPGAVNAAVTTDGDLGVDYTGDALGPLQPLTVGSPEVHALTEAVVGSDPATVRLTLDLARYRRFRVMSLAASEAQGARIVVDVYRRVDGPPSDGPPLVCLDPGHGGSDNHATGTWSGVLEKNVNLSMCLLAMADIGESGLRVMSTRTSDITVALGERCSLANAAGASLFVSVHNNGFDDATVGGTETFYNVKTASYTAASKALAEAVQRRLVAALGFRDRGARAYYSGGLAVLSGTSMPGVLVEVGFMTNRAEDLMVSSPAGQQKAAKAIADAVRDYLGWSTSVYNSEW